MGKSFVSLSRPSNATDQEPVPKMTPTVTLQRLARYPPCGGQKQPGEEGIPTFLSRDPERTERGEDGKAELSTPHPDGCNGFPSFP